MNAAVTNNAATNVISAVTTVANALAAAGTSFLGIIKKLPEEARYVLSFLACSVFLVLLSVIVSRIVAWLHKNWAGPRPAGEKAVAFSKVFARFEQALIYLAAVAGKDVFGFAIAGWLALKGVSEYARWKPPETKNGEPPEGKPGEAEALAHNRRLIFIAGTGMSIAAAALAGTAFHFVCDWLRK